MKANYVNTDTFKLNPNRGTFSGHLKLKLLSQAFYLGALMPTVVNTKQKDRLSTLRMNIESLSYLSWVLANPS